MVTVSASTSILNATEGDSRDSSSDHETYKLKVSLDRCKFFPFTPLAVLAGSVIESESDLLKPAERCMVDTKTGVKDMIERWANESRKKKCTGWVKMAVPIDMTCQIIKTDVLERSRNLGVALLKGKVTDISDPPTYELKFRMDQVKFYPTKLAVLDGLVIEADESFNQKHNHILSKGEKCWVHLRVGVVALMQTLKGVAEAHAKNNSATGWIKFTESIPVTSRIVYTPAVLERNRKGALMLECFELIDIQLPESGEVKFMRLGERSFQSNSDLPMLRDRRERHTVFAQWLIDKYGVDKLSSGSGVLDVAGGKGELSQALFDLGVTKSTIIDPDPRCDGDVPYKIISEPLSGDGSDLTDRQDHVGEVVRSCSIIAGMHPDQATEAIVDTSLRLGVPFAILPCCVMPKLFPNRVQKQHGHAVRSYNTFCQYLLDKAPAGIRFKVDYCHFQGRNKVIYSESLKYCQPIPLQLSEEKSANVSNKKVKTG